MKEIGFNFMKELGYSDEDINQMISEYDIPLDDDALEEAAGGSWQVVMAWNAHVLSDYLWLLT